ncbi:MAG: hypothetical protein ACT452_18210, partial [Microthrixaceae bacterium]
MPSAHAVHTKGAPVSAVLRLDDGGTLDLDIDRWRSAPDRHESALLDQIPDPVLDVGCGPGRGPPPHPPGGGLARGRHTPRAAP